MKQSDTSHPGRIHALDGLRGLAIILVILNHLRLDPIQRVFPNWPLPIFAVFNVNGKVGVSLLFLLSGYLLGTFYPHVKHIWAFLQKRYTRIFPPLLTMVLSLGIIRLYWQSLSSLDVFLIVIAVTLVCGLLWKTVQKLKQRTTIAKMAFMGFFALQVAVALFYVFILPRVPAPVFYQVWEPWKQAIVTVFVNATMTLPLGNYIAQLDGVYWSLTAEVLFYLLYPTLALPLIDAFRRQTTNAVKALSIGLLFVFMYGGYILFKHGVWGFYVLNFNFFIYFFVGVLIAQFQMHPFPLWTKWQEALARVRWKGTVGLLTLLLGSVWIYQFFPESAMQLVQMLWVIPTALVFSAVLVPNTFSRIFQSKFLVYLGSISYSLYLTHTIAAETMSRDGAPMTFWSSLVTAVIVVGISLGLAMLLNRYLELPYFNKDVEAEAKLKEASMGKRISPVITVSLFCATFIFFIWLANRPPVNPFSFVEPHHDTSVSERLLLGTTPQDISFTPTDDYLGTFLIDLERVRKEKNVPAFDELGNPTVLNVELVDPQHTLITSSQFNINFIEDGRHYPIGIPIQQQSKGTTYTAKLSVLHGNTNEQVYLLNDMHTIESVHIVPKSLFLKEPQRMVKHVVLMGLYPFKTREALLELLLMAPFLAMSLWVVVKDRKTT